MKKIGSFIIFLFFGTILNSYGQKYEEFDSLGQLKATHSDYRGAIEDYNKAIELKPDYAEAYNNRGLAKLRLDDKIGAIEVNNPDYTEPPIPE